MSSQYSPEEALKHYFNFTCFRQGQKEVVEKVLNGNNVLAVMPTGLGKSLCYQLPAFMLPGIAVVISPLVALMKDQVDALYGKNLSQATYISSQLAPEEQRRRLEEMGREKYKIVYVAPERLKSRMFLAQLARLKVSLLTVDEAHCISHWGHDFRPDYLYIREFYEQIPGSPVILALTATATPAVQKDILEQLGIPGAHRVISGSDRPNLYYSAGNFDSDGAKLAELQRLLSGRRGSGLVYVATRKEAERVAQWVSNNLKMTAAAYHAGLEPAGRSRVQEDFLQGGIDVVVCTNAFGMGIDKPDIRFVIHYCMPSSMEAYYQEVGRAGRDGQPARCSLLFTQRDRQLQEWIIDNDALGKEDIINFWRVYRECLQGDVSVISCAALEQKNIDEIKVRLLLAILERLQVARLADRNGDSLYLEAGSRSPTGPLMNSVLHELRQRTAARKEKLASMLNWIHHSGCRRSLLLNYFGESVPERVEVCCDNCRDTGSGRMPVSLLPLEIFAAVKELPRPLGQKKLTDVLRGSRARDITGWGYHNLECYSKLSSLSAAAVRGLINQLIGDGFLGVAGDEYPVVVLTPRGDDILKSGEALPVRDVFLPRVKTSASTGAEVQPRDGELLARLKDFRTGLARQESMPPYVFFHDRVLVELADRKPLTRAELMKVKGLGEKKIDRFGEQLINIIQTCAGGHATGPDGVGQAGAPAGAEIEAISRFARGSLVADNIEGLFKEGLSAQAIAYRLGFPEDVVEGYLAGLVAENRINIDDLVPWPMRRQIYLAMEQAGIKRPAAIRQLLPESIPGSAIRYVRACLLKDGRLQAEDVTE